jgi:hypothetical protein
VPLVAAVGIVGWLLLGLGLLIRRSPLLAWGVAGFGAEYALFLRLHGGPVDAQAPLVAAAVLLAAELAYLSIGGWLPGADRVLVLRTAGALAAAATTAALVGGLLLVAGGSASAGLALEAAGVAAAVLAVAFVVRIAAGSKDSTST